MHVWGGGRVLLDEELFCLFSVTLMFEIQIFVFIHFHISICYLYYSNLNSGKMSFICSAFKFMIFVHLISPCFNEPSLPLCLIFNFSVYFRFLVFYCASL